MAFSSSFSAWVGMGILLASIVAVMCETYYSDDPVQNYRMLPTSLGQERALCYGKKSRCQMRILRCPTECPVRKPKQAKKKKGCLIDCSNKCETTCKFRKPNCKGYGSICYDPRFVGGDGVLFYFHGAIGRDFALVSDRRLQINAHFIGVHPADRKRPFTWVQSLGLLFGSHNFTISATRAAAWDDATDHLRLTFDGQDVTIPTEALASWVPPSGGATLTAERTDDTNGVNVAIPGLAEINVAVVPILERESAAHNYQLPADDIFAHLEMQFKFFNLSADVEGVLGQTYRPGFVNPAKRGVQMPMLGGEDKYATSSLLSADCNLCNYAGTASGSSVVVPGLIVSPAESFNTECRSRNGNGGIVCRR